MVVEIVDWVPYSSPRPAALRGRDYHSPRVSIRWRTLEILPLERQRWVVAASHGGEETIRAEPFEAVAIELLAVRGE